MSQIAYPQFSPTIGRVFGDVGASRLAVSDRNNVTVREAQYFHRQLIVNGGTALSNSQFTFFANTGTVPFVSNMPLQGQLPTDNGFWLHSIHATLIFGLNGAQAVAGTPAAPVGAGYLRDKGAATNDPGTPTVNTVQAAEASRLLAYSGYGSMRVGDTLVDDGMGLGRWPSHYGPDGQASVGTAANAAVSQDILAIPSTGNVNNKPVLSKLLNFPILPGKTINFTLSYPSALSLFSNNQHVWLEITLRGILVAPANN